MDRNAFGNADALTHRVALRKESVDRNLLKFCVPEPLFRVALRKESVDRNNAGALPYNEEKGRSPQGERG